MSLSFHSNKECLYLQVYEHYKNLIMERRIPAGSRMPSLRKCSAELKLSRTTIENAYLQLAADGYIVARAQSGYQQGRHHAQEDVFDVGHAATALLMAGSSPRIASVSSISHQKVGFAGEVSGQKQPTVQSRYSANAKHSTPMWKYRIFRAAPICVFA